MTATAGGVVLAAGTWTVVVDRTRATFTVRNLGVKEVEGRIPVTAGELELDGAGRPVLLHAELDLDRIDTGIARRDRDLRTPNLLDIDRHPTMTYTASAFRAVEQGWAADGTLGLRGTSCPLELTGTVVPGRSGGAVHVVGSAVLDRRDVGMRAPRFLISTRIDVRVDAWLTRR